MLFAQALLALQRLAFVLLSLVSRAKTGVEIIGCENLNFSESYGIFLRSSRLLPPITGAAARLPDVGVYLPIDSGLVTDFQKEAGLL